MSTYKIIMSQKNSSGNYDILLPKSFGNSFINVAATAGTKITVTGPNSYNQTYNLSQNENAHGFPVIDDGSYTLKVVFTDGTQKSKTVYKSGDGIFTYFFSEYDSVLNNNTWEKISKASSAGVASSLWSIGDVKMDTINGTFANTTINGDYGFFIIDFDHNSNIEGKGISFMGFKTTVSNGTDICFVASNYGEKKQDTGFIINQYSPTNSDTNVGGWKSSYMRTTIIPSFKQALSSDLRSVLKITPIYSDNTGGGQQDSSNVTSTEDDIYLAAEFEIFGSRTNANPAEKNYQTQFIYYKNGNSNIKKIYNDTFHAYWWLRSPCDIFGYQTFCFVTDGGNAYQFKSSDSLGFAPVFRV